jgi:hypothetical protein
MPELARVPENDCGLRVWFKARFAANKPVFGSLFSGTADFQMPKSANAFTCKSAG